MSGHLIARLVVSRASLARAPWTRAAPSSPPPSRLPLARARARLVIFARGTRTRSVGTHAMATVSSSSSSLPAHRVGDTFRVKGLELTDHFFACPLDHAVPEGEQIEVFAREVVAVDKARQGASDDPDASASAKRAKMPHLLYLQGGPGFEAARPTEIGGWLAHACETHRVILLDQRGTGRSTAVSVASLARRGDVATQAAYASMFRADAIVKDAETIRAILCGRDVKWSVLGQSFGGFCIAHYLSFHSGGLREAFLTGGLPPLVREENAAAATYERLVERVMAQNEKYYARFPNDARRVKSIVNFVASNPEKSATPNGGRLTPRMVQALGFSALGTAGGMESLHYLLEKAWDVDGDALSYRFLKGCEDVHAFDTNPLYAILHESIYCNGGGPSAWAAEAAIRRRWAGAFDPIEAAAAIDDDATRVLFTGEMIFPHMFDDVAPLRALKPVAEALAAKTDWGVLYDADALNACDVPVACAAYYEDAFVDVELGAATAREIRGARVWTTSEYMHSGVREDGARILKKLMAMARDEEVLR